MPAFPSELLELVPYSIDLLGLIEEERTRRSAEHECVNRLKTAGLIR